MTDAHASATSWRNGQFCAAPAPDWWGEVFERCYPSISEAPRFQSVMRLGDELGAEFEAFRAPGGAFVGYIGTPDHCWPVFFGDEIALLDFVTTRVPAWLSVNSRAADELATIRAAIIAYARHGTGEHIDEDGGFSHIDTARRREMRRKARA